MNFSKLLLAGLVIVLPISNPAFADSYSDAMATCLADSTTGKDRKDLARWMFAIMTLHPEVANIATISTEDREAAHKTAGLLLNRLLLDNCKKEFVASVKNDSDATKASFEALGRMAMQELMVDPNVAKGMTNFIKYIDLQSLRETMTAK